MERPAGVTTIAAIFLLIASLSFICSVAMRASPGALSMLDGSALRRQLEVIGPNGVLFLAAVWGLLGWGLFHLYNWARIAAMVLLILGVGVASPRLITASHFSWSLVWGGVEIVVRLLVVCYLFRAPVAKQFSKPARTT